MIIKLIVAVAKGNNAIGKNNQLLWYLPEDMRFFKDTTSGFPIITGRKNYESIPDKFRPLPGRDNIIITRDLSYQAPGAYVCHSIEKALEKARTCNKVECYVIGGGQIYKQCLMQGLVDELYVTWVDAEIEADTFFEGFVHDDWVGKRLMTREKNAGNEYSFEVIKYTKYNKPCGKEKLKK